MPPKPSFSLVSPAYGGRPSHGEDDGGGRAGRSCISPASSRWLTDCERILKTVCFRGVEVSGHISATGALRRSAAHCSVGTGRAGTGLRCRKWTAVRDNDATNR
jgi:hypothetical protein